MSNTPYNTGGIPGPERSLTWVNQPEKLFGSTNGVPFKPGQARYGNAVFTYRPDFTNGDYREGIIAEDEKQLTFEFYSPYIIAATPASTEPWGIYEPGCRNGLILRGSTACEISVSVDQGKTWQSCGVFRDGMDLTDQVKGRRQYFLRLHTNAETLRDSGLSITTVCQANPSTMPRLNNNGGSVRFHASGRAVISAGPNLPQAQAHLIEGAFGTPKVTLELSAPRGEQLVSLHAAAHVLSGNPPDPKVKYRIEASCDDGTTWLPVVKDWVVSRRGDEPKEFWSQCMCWGSIQLPAAPSTPVRVRFSNDGGRSYARCEAHLVYRAKVQDATKVAFAWTDDRGPQQADHVFPTIDEAGSGSDEWKIPTGKNVQTRWIEFEPVLR
ncbi:hypothetical protein ACXR0O_25940 [Verrucomicrobiota bacterium sgz303538]